MALFARDVESLNAVKESIERWVGERNASLGHPGQGRNRCGIRDALDTFGHVDILVNNAGVNVRKPVLELAPEEWDLVINTNLKGYLLMAQAVVPHMLSRGSGKVINMASILGSVALPSQVAYASSKGGVIQMTKVMALEWAKQGVQVNAIGPTYFETPLVAQLRNDPERYNFIVERTPMGRWGQPDELAGVVCFWPRERRISSPVRQSSWMGAGLHGSAGIF